MEVLILIHASEILNQDELQKFLPLGMTQVESEDLLAEIGDGARLSAGTLLVHAHANAPVDLSLGGQALDTADPHVDVGALLARSHLHKSQLLFHLDDVLIQDLDGGLALL